MTTATSHLAHWGAYLADVAGNQIVDVRPHPLDADPSPLLGNIPGSTSSPVLNRLINDRSSRYCSPRRRASTTGRDPPARSYSSKPSRTHGPY